jgi:hypothetical protein
MLRPASAQNGRAHMAKAMIDLSAPLQTQRAVHRSVQAERSFYVIAAIVILIVTAVGFRLFLLHGKGVGGGEMTRQIVPLIIAHGLAMFSWVVLFLVQSILILVGKRRFHMLLGFAGAGLAAAIVALGSATAALSVHFSAEGYGPLGGARFFLAIMFSEMICFGAFVSIGVIFRRRAEIHRPLMLLATIVITSGSLFRFPYISDIALTPPLYVLGPMLLFGALLFLLQWAMTRVASRWFAVGYSGLGIAALISVVIGRSALWNQIAGAIVP